MSKRVVFAIKVAYETQGSRKNYLVKYAVFDYQEGLGLAQPSWHGEARRTALENQMISSSV